MKRNIGLVALVIVSTCHVPGGSNGRAEGRDERIDRIAAILEENYVFPSVAGRAADSIRQRQKAGLYASMQDRDLAVRLTADLQAITRDKHLIVSFSPKPVPQPEKQHEISAAERRRMEDFAKSVNYGFTKVELLPGDIGYLRVDGFMPADVGGPTLAAAMTSFANTKALIIDLRYSDNGGDPSMVALICGYLTGPEPVHLSDMRFRSGRSVENWTPKRVKGPRYLSRPVMVLTSPRTFSAGEELAYNLQALKRAIIIGEPTGGGTNPGHAHWISDHLSIFVPDGEAVSAITGENWGWSGVVPDIRTPADAALTQAEKRLPRSQQSGL